MVVNNKKVNIFVVIFLLGLTCVSTASVSDKIKTANTGSAIEIYLPREITIDHNAPNLGQVSIIRGDKSLVAKASKISLGRISQPGQEIIIDRPTVLSRLACNGIPGTKVTLTGAEKITIRQQQEIVDGAEFVKLASSFLEKNPLYRSVCRPEPIRIPDDLILPSGSKDIKLVPSLLSSGAKNKTKIKIDVLLGGKKVGTREMTFRLKYNNRQAVTAVDLAEGDVVSPKNIKIENILSDYPEDAGWSVPYGLVAKRSLPANTVLQPNMVGPVKHEVIVKRNQNVVIQIDRPGLVVTAVGKTMQQGSAGEYIKVRNVDSQRIILAKINEDGTVEPVF
jgi:flagella basal body P-ring formation protein FlgA